MRKIYTHKPATRCKLPMVSIACIVILNTCALYTQVLRSVRHTVPPYIDFFQYNQQQEVTGMMSTTKDTSVAIMFYRLTRDAEKKLTNAEIRDAGNTLLYSFQYTYNNEGQLIKLVKISDTDFDNQVDDMEYTYSMSYDSLGLLTHMRIHKHFTLARDFEFIWKEGNIVQVINTDGELNYRLFMEYDQSLNPLRAIRWEYFITTGNIEFYATIFSANNLTRAVLVPAAMDTIDLEIQPLYIQGRYISNTMEGVYFEYE